MLTTLLLAASTGFVSTLHCWGMCGGIVAALALGAPPALRTRGGAMTGLAVAYNLGRIASYAGLGAMAGLAATSVAGASGGSAYLILQALGLLALLFAALRLGGWLPRNGIVERIGLRFWQRLNPLTRRLLPIDRASRAVAAGLLWGFLPCGLVYAMLPISAGTGSAAGGALTMLAFGAGTLPGMITASVAANRLGGLKPGPGLRRYAAAALITLSLGWYGLQWLDAGDAHSHAQHAAAPATAPADAHRGHHGMERHGHAMPDQAPAR